MYAVDSLGNVLIQLATLVTDLVSTHYPSCAFFHSSFWGFISEKIQQLSSQHSITYNPHKHKIPGGTLLNRNGCEGKACGTNMFVPENETDHSKKLWKKSQERKHSWHFLSAYVGDIVHSTKL